MSVAVPSDAMQQALELHRAGDLRQAAIAYEHIIHSTPAHAEAWHMLGVLSHQLGKNELALRCIAEAVKLDPIQAAYHSNLGVVYLALDRINEAIASYRLAILRKQDYPEAFCNLGHALIKLRDFDEADKALREALRLQGEYPEVQFNLGQLAQERGHVDEAIRYYREALRLRGDYIEPLNNLAVLLKNRGEFDEAQQLLQKSLELNPRVIEARYNLAQTKHAQGRLVEAVELYQRFLHDRPQYASGHNNLGNALEDLGQVDDAIICYRTALQIKPDLLEAYNNLAHAFQVQGKLQEAKLCYHEALKLGTRHPVVLSNWLFFLNYLNEVEQKDLFKEHRRWGKQFGYEDRPMPDYPHDRSPERKLRVGYVSPDFHEHAVARFMEPLLAYHDHEQFEVYLYADVAVSDVTSQTFAQLADHWRVTRWLDHDQLAEQIRSDQIDILVDLAGHTAWGRLPVFARRVAPVQVSYLGYPNTTGLEAMQYRLTDAVCDPISDPILHSEDLVRLAPSFACFAPPIDIPESGPLPYERNKFITFGSLHSLAKLNEDVLDLWAKVLKANPRSRLLMYRDALNGSAVEHFIAQFEKRAVDRSRLELRCGPPGGAHHLSQYHDIDVSLDPFPWSGHTTACESLWQGVPVITLRGQRYAARMVSSLLHTLGHGEWIAESPEQYVKISTHLANSPAQLAALRLSLRRELLNSGACDGVAFTHSLESAYRLMWQDWCRTSARAGHKSPRKSAAKTKSTPKKKS